MIKRKEADEKYGYAVVQMLLDLGIDDTSFRARDSMRHPETMYHRKGYARPLSMMVPSEPIDWDATIRTHDYAACPQDLVDAGFMTREWWHDGYKTMCGFALTANGAELVRELNNEHSGD